MKKTIIWIIAAVVLIVSGGLLFGGIMARLDWDFSKLSTVRYETNTYDITDDFSGISIKADTADIRFVLSDDGTCRVDCFEDAHQRHTVAVNDGTLTILANDERTPADVIRSIGINFDTPTVTVTLPKTEFSYLLIHNHTGDVTVPHDFQFENADIALSTGDISYAANATKSVRLEASTGRITVEEIRAASLHVRTSTGKVDLISVQCDAAVFVQVTTGKATLTDVTCRSLHSMGDTGSITMTNLLVKGPLVIERSTGDIRFERCDAAELTVTTDTGDVSGSLLSDKRFFVQTDTGDVQVPDAANGGRCDITTDTGDIRLTVEPFLAFAEN